MCEEMEGGTRLCVQVMLFSYLVGLFIVNQHGACCTCLTDPEAFVPLLIAMAIESSIPRAGKRVWRAIEGGGGYDSVILVETSVWCFCLLGCLSQISLSRFSMTFKSFNRRLPKETSNNFICRE